MAADHVHATLFTGPLFRLCVEEILEAVIPNEFKVLDHAQVVFCAVTLVEPFQAFAGKIRTLETKSDLTQTKLFAVVTHVQTVFAARQAAGTVCSVKTLRVEVMLLKLIGNTQSAVHPAGCNQFFSAVLISRLGCHHLPLPSIKAHEHDSSRHVYEAHGSDLVNLIAIDENGFTVI